MSVYVPVAKTIQCELRQTLGGEQLMNVLHFEKDSTVTVADMEQLGGQLVSWWGDWMKPEMSSNLSFNEVYMTDLTSIIGATVSWNTDLPMVGDQVVESMPSNAAACISFKTPFRGRSYQGRNYIAGVPISRVLLNTMDLDLVADLKNAYSKLLEFSGDIGCTHVVVSRYTGYTIVGTKKIPTPRVAGITSNVTAYNFASAYIKTQRDRLPK